MARPVHPWRPLGWFAPPFARNVGHTLPPLEPASTILFPGAAWRGPGSARRGAERSGENETAVTGERRETKRSGRRSERGVKRARERTRGEEEVRNGRVEWMKEEEKRGARSAADKLPSALSLRRYNKMISGRLYRDSGYEQPSRHKVAALRAYGGRDK